MLERVGNAASSRKSKLLALFMVQSCLDRCSSPLVRHALGTIEMVFNGVVSGLVLPQLETSLKKTFNALPDHKDSSKESFLVVAQLMCCESANWRLPYSVFNWLMRYLDTNETVPIAIREFFGNPFRPVALDPRWHTSDVVGLARAIYDDKAFERMPILADALMDAGCEDEQVIGHCRGDGRHERGCWVVDLVLGKE
jgi:hypothetical protein